MSNNTTAASQAALPSIVDNPPVTTLTPQPRNLVAGNWHQPLRITKNNFVNKSLSMWACNLAIGCTHGCRFCYVPSAATNKLAPMLAEYGIDTAFVKPKLREYIEDEAARAVALTAHVQSMRTMNSGRGHFCALCAAAAVSLSEFAPASSSMRRRNTASPNRKACRRSELQRLEGV